MKKMKFNRLLAIIAMFGVAVFTSCKKDDPEGKTDEVYYEIDPEGTVTYTSEELAEIVLGGDGANDDEDTKELRELFWARENRKEAELNEELGANGISMRYVSYKYKYYSKDQFGQTILLSARVGWSQYWFFGWHNLDPDNLYLWEHYTITKDAEAPSNDGSTELFIMGDNLMIMPDYIGYGVSKDLVHPYLNHEVTAINSIDAIEPGIAIWKKYGSGTMEDDWKMYVMGCSQGASNALAVHKYLETHPELSNKYRFDYSYCCAGAYNPALTMDTYYSWGKTAYIGSIPMTIKSMLACYPNDIMTGWHEEDFYCEKYLKIKDQVDELLKKKEVDATELNKKIKSLLGTDDPQLKDVLSEKALDKSSPLAENFFKCLEKNNLTTGWTPSHLIKLYASKDDDIVPYANTEAVKNAFGDKVSVFHSYWAGHVLTCKKWYGTFMVINGW